MLKRSTAPAARRLSSFRDDAKDVMRKFFSEKQEVEVEMITCGGLS